MARPPRIARAARRRPADRPRCHEPATSSWPPEPRADDPGCGLTRRAAVVRITAPGRDLVYAGGNPRIAFDARATDDFGLRSLALHYTKVRAPASSSSSRKEDPADADACDVARLERHAPRGARRARSARTATCSCTAPLPPDARPGDGSGSSDAFFIEISKLGAAAGDAFTLPEEETRYALSQQMLIVKTERLHQRRATVAADALARKSLNLAVEQRMIRAEFVFMLGGEIEDEEVEARAVERAAGRAAAEPRSARSARRDGRDESGGESADAARTTAERSSRSAPRLQRFSVRSPAIATSCARSATRSQLDLSRRLTGNAAGCATGGGRVLRAGEPTRRCSCRIYSAASRSSRRRRRRQPAARRCSPCRRFASIPRRRPCARRRRRSRHSTPRRPIVRPRHERCRPRRPQYSPSRAEATRTRRVACSCRRQISPALRRRLAGGRDDACSARDRRVNCRRRNRRSGADPGRCHARPGGDHRPAAGVDHRRACARRADPRFARHVRHRAGRDLRHRRGDRRRRSLSRRSESGVGVERYVRGDRIDRVDGARRCCHRGGEVAARGCAGDDDSPRGGPRCAGRGGAND